MISKVSVLVPTIVDVETMEANDIKVSAYNNRT
jgi:hypothetical protein